MLPPSVVVQHYRRGIWIIMMDKFMTEKHMYFVFGKSWESFLVIIIKIMFRTIHQGHRENSEGSGASVFRNR